MRLGTAESRVVALEQRVQELTPPHTELEQRVEELEIQLENSKRQLRGFTKHARDQGGARLLLAEREAELEAARANARGLAEDVVRKDEAIQQLTANAEAAAARAAEALRVAEAAAMRAQLDHHVWSLGTKLAAQGVAAQKDVPPPPAVGQATRGPEDGLADWLTHGGTDAVCSVVATALCKLVEAIGTHPPGLCSNGFLKDGAVAATAKAAKAAAGRESQHWEHPGGNPLDVLKAALDGAAAHVVGPRGASSAAAEAPESAVEAVDAQMEAPDAESDVQMEQLFQIVQLIFDANHDEFMDVGEMKLYLVAVGAWGSEPVYSDEKWPRAWPGICALMEADGEQGLPLSSFKMYHKKYRRGKLAHDLNQLSFGISNPAARGWWRTHIGLRRSVRVQVAADAFAVWLKLQGLPATEAQIFGGLAAHGVGADVDGDVTVGNFETFTAGMGGEFTVAAVRSREVIRADVDAGSAKDFARHIGIDMGAEPELMCIAEQCRVAPLPANWVEYFTAEGDSYFHNVRRGNTLWHHPLDLFFKQLVQERRADGNT
jgi:hypothetical protein